MIRVFLVCCGWQAERGKYDLVVVGGDPAGATISAVMARKGKKVLLVERDWSEPDRCVPIVAGCWLLVAGC